MAERHVLVRVKIATEGRRCLDWNDAEACPYLSSEWATCRLFHADLGREERDDDAYGYLRAPGCLALDGGGVGEPNGVGEAESSAALDPLLVGVDP